MRRVFSALEPGESLAEILFGLVMVLTFTLGARLVAPESQDELRGVLISALGCNLAWGIIDGVFFVMGRMFQHHRAVLLLRQLRATDDRAALGVIRDQLSGDLLARAAPAAREALHAQVLALVRTIEPRRPGLSRDDLAGGIAAGMLVFASAIPAILPFLVIDDSYTALRASNAILVALLFLVGFRWARHAGVNPWRSGILMLVLGLALVAVAIALGG
jgi:hypothetical protein